MRRPGCDRRPARSRTRTRAAPALRRAVRAAVAGSPRSRRRGSRRSAQASRSSVVAMLAILRPPMSSRPATPSLIYRSPLVYGLAMAVLYGRYYRARSRSVAALVAPGASVLELCCGPGTLYLGHLRAKGVRYRGLDLNPVFVDAAAPARRRRRGGRRGRRRAAPARGRRPHPGQPLPLPPRRAPADRPHARRRAADGDRQRAGAQPGHEPAAAGRPAGRGERVARATATTQTASPKQALDALMAGYGDACVESRRIPGGRDKIYVLRGTADADL